MSLQRSISLLLWFFMWVIITFRQFVCLFDLILYVPSTIFPLNRDRSSWVEPVLSYDKCVLLKNHNTVTPVRLKPAYPQSWVKHSTTEPLGSHCSPVQQINFNGNIRWYLALSKFCLIAMESWRPKLHINTKTSSTIGNDRSPGS